MSVGSLPEAQCSDNLILFHIASTIIYRRRSELTLISFSFFLSSLRRLISTRSCTRNRQEVYGAGMMAHGYLFRRCLSSALVIVATNAIVASGHGAGVAVGVGVVIAAV